MRVALFTHTCYPFTNGVAISVEQLAKTLVNNGHEVTIVTNNYKKFKNDFSDNEKIKVISIPIFYQKLRVPILFNSKLFKELDKHNIQIVHSHSDFGLAILSRVYAKRRHLPLIQTYHCNYLGYAKKNFGRLSYYIFYLPVKLYTKLLCKTADRVIVPSLTTKKLIKEKFKVKKDIYYVPNGVNLSKFDNKLLDVSDLRKKLKINENDFVLLSLSRLSKEKGISTIISSLTSLKDCERLKLLIVGGGKEENKLKKLVNKLNLDNAIFTGEIPFEKVQDYYALADVFITNSYAETQGLTVIEALSSNIPVICPNISVYQEIINKDNGLLFKNNSELINKIRYCYNNLKSIKNKNIRKTVERFSLDITVKKIEDIYDEMFMYNNYLGKIIKIKIDRQLGMKHPKYDLIYPINYGYVPNTISGDGEELDAYLLGVNDPVDEYVGECIAIIHRTNDNDDKLVIVPVRKKYTNEEIDTLTEFQEKYFKHIIIRKGD